MLNKRWLFLLCVLMHSGCSLLSPTETKPTLLIPHKWPVTNLSHTTKAVNLPATLWWKQFKNSELDDFVQKAIEHNSESQVALANIEYARSQLEQVQLNWIPNVSVLAGFSQFPVLGNPGAVALAYPAYIVNILQLYKQQKSARAIYEASIAVKDSVRLLVIAQTVGTYFTLIAQNEALTLYSNQLKEYQADLKITRSKYASGLTSQDDVDKVNSNIKQVQSQIELTQHNIVVSKNALHYLFNENPGNIITKTSFQTFNSNALIPSNLPISVLNSRPDVHEAEALLRAAEADVGAVAANLLPTVTLGAFLGAGSQIDGPIKLGQGYLTGPVFNLPLFAQISSSKARYKAYYLKYVMTVRQALRDVTNDLSAFSTYSHQLKNNESAIMDEGKHCHLAALRDQYGLDDPAEAIRCRIELNKFALRVNQNKLEKMIAMVTLYQDLGGGYHGGT